ncbi:MAG: S8 family serine peptidase [Muribaculaceae bacterium]|nr:S8 family serine peptidase [Muribaculaceae bacterium]
MKKSLLFCGLVAAACVGNASAQSKINGAGRLMIDEYKTIGKSVRSAAPEVSVMVTLEKGAEASALAAKGYEVLSVVADMAIVKLPLDKVEALAAMDEVFSVDFLGESRPYLDKGREVTNVDALHNASDEQLAGHSYTGEGVIVGLYDTGLDPNHAAFRNADGTSRVKGLFIRKSDSALNRDYTNPDDIINYVTETPTATHGTHVLGIMGGSKDVQGVYATSNSSGEVAGSIPYYGPAYNADMLVGCGDFYDSCILSGIEKVVNYAQELGKPAVVNLSLGNNAGSHHPLSSTGRFLDALGDKAIICISAGNEGTNPLAVSRAFNARYKTLNTFIVPQNVPTGSITFTAEFWADNDKPFEVNLVVYDKLDNKVVETVPVTTSGSLNSSSAAFTAQYTNASRVSGTAGLDRSTNCYNAYFSGTLQAKATPTRFVGVNITGTAGQTVYGWINTIATAEDPDKLNPATFSAENVTGYLNGSCNGTINGFGCGEKIVSVGAYVSRTGAPYIGTGGYGGSAGSIGAIANFSSYGKTLDGRQLPHVAAPGAQVVSAVSTTWFNNDDKMSPERVNARSDLHGRVSYYYPMQGTSMSSPFAAGIIALWLEANPNLTIEQVHDIIKKTSIKDSYVNSASGDNPLRWGSGKIDALAGLKEALNIGAGIEGVKADLSEKNLIIANLGGSLYEFTFVGADNMEVGVYNLQGAQVLTASAAGDSVQVDASSLQSGVYVVTADTPAGRVSRKLAVK